jgi:3-methylcrotonyl-CoA carboxylase alpha subunit
LIDSTTKDFYFCEMNTRLQVEHPVTEMITGVDLVEWQLLVAAGHPIPLSQEEIIKNSKGHALEARIYAENPIKDFLPSTGVIKHLTNPAIDAKEDGIRVDTGISAGNAISTFYDPMIAKLITFGSDRTEALDKMQRALRDYQVAGLANNIDFLVTTIQRPDFIEAKATTAFFEHNMSAILSAVQSSSPEETSRFAAFAATAVSLTKLLSTARTVAGLWDGTGHNTLSWRQHTTSGLTLQLKGDSKNIAVRLNQSPASRSSANMNVTIKHKDAQDVELSEQVELISHSILRRSQDSITWSISLALGNLRLSGTVCISNNSSGGNDVLDVWIDGQVGHAKSHYQFLSPHINHASAGNSSSNPVVLSPMPGKVVKIFVVDGSIVKQGDTIAVIEAMKMEHSVSSYLHVLVILILI